MISGNGRYGILLSGTTPTSTVIEATASARMCQAREHGQRRGRHPCDVRRQHDRRPGFGRRQRGFGQWRKRDLGERGVCDRQPDSRQLGVRQRRARDRSRRKRADGERPERPDAGANNLQNFPVLTAASGGVDGILNSRPNTTYRIEYFGSASCDPSGHGEGQVLLARRPSPPTRRAARRWPFMFGGSGLFVTATATHSGTNDTSEFSECVQPTAAFRTSIGSTGGNWEDPTKWSDGVVPEPGEIAIIGANGTVVVSSATVALEQIFSTAHIAMSGGALRSIPTRRWWAA